MSEPETWNILTQTQAGQVSLLKNLTEDEARGCMQRLQPSTNPWSDEIILWHASQSVGIPSRQQMMVAMQRGNGINHAAYTSIECWGSRDGKLEVWPKPDGYETKLAEAMEVASLVKRTNDEIGRAGPPRLVA